MKNIIIIILMLFLFSKQLAAQISISPFLSTNYEKKNEVRTKNKIGSGLILNYDFRRYCGVGIQYRSYELWRINSNIESTIPLQTMAVRFYLFPPQLSNAKIFFTPKVGLMAGIGTPVTIRGKDRNIMMQDLDLLQHPYFIGIFFEANAGVWITKKIAMQLFLKTEGLAGVIRDRPSTFENGSSSSNFSAGLTFAYHFPIPTK